MKNLKYGSNQIDVGPGLFPTTSIQRYCLYTIVLGRNVYLEFHLMWEQHKAANTEHISSTVDELYPAYCT